MNAIFMVFVLASYGTTLIVTQGRLFAGLRAAVAKRVPTLAYLLTCPMCFGVWAGWAWALLGLWPPTGAGRLVDVVAAGACASGSTWILHHIARCLGALLARMEERP